MKKRNKILCGVLGLLLVCTAGVVWWQWENLNALKAAVQYSSEELEEQMQQNQQAIQDAVNAAPEVVIRDVTEEERAALKDGTLTQEELIDRLVNVEAPPAPVLPEEQPPADTPPPAQSQPVAPPGAVQPEETPPEEIPQVDPDYQKKLSAIIAEVYVLREQYTIKLDDMYAAAKAEYKAMSAADKSADKLAKWAMGYVSQASRLEKSCDATMDSIVARMEELIRANNGDLSLVDTVVYTYASEKSLKKAFYMSKLEKRGLI